MAESESRALCAWLSLFAQSRIESLSEVLDCSLVSRIFMEMCRLEEEEEEEESSQEQRKFDSEVDVSSRWRRLIARMCDWYESKKDEIRQPTAQFLASVRDAASRIDEEYCALGTRLALCACVQCVGKARYIGAIMRELEESDQATLMVVVERTLSASSPADQTSGSNRARASSTTDDEDAMRWEEVENLRQVCENLRVENARLADEAEARRLEAASALERASRARSDEGGDLAASFARIKELEQALELSRNSLRSCELEADSLRRSNGSLNVKLSKSEEANARLQDARHRLEDELDVCRSHSLELDRAQHVIETLEKKVEESNELRREIRELDAAGSRQLQEIVELEAAKKRAESKAADASRLRSDLQAKSRECFDAKAQLELVSADLERCRQELEEAREARRFFEDRDHDQMRQLQAVAAAENSSNSHRVATTAAAEATIAPKNLLEESTAELRATVERLSREKAQLLASNSSDEENNASIEAALLQASDRERDALEARKAQAAAEAQVVRLKQELLEARAEKEVLQDEPPRSDATIVSKEDSESPESSSRHQHHDSLEERDAKIRELSEERTKLESYMRKTLQNVQNKYSVLMHTYKSQLREKQDRIEALETKVKSERAAHKREEQLLVSTVYDVGQRLIDNSFTAQHGGGAEMPAPPGNLQSLSRGDEDLSGGFKD